jgi:hypothetical protein
MIDEDKNLLELAAKAAGLPDYFEGMVSSTKDGPLHIWNPLKDDGDALRLAVKLRLSVEMSQELVMVGCDEKFSGWFEERTDVDPNAATRRAIVRAAAEVGKVT